MAIGSPGATTDVEVLDGIRPQIVHLARLAGSLFVEGVPDVSTT